MKSKRSIVILLVGLIALVGGSRMLADSHAHHSRVGSHGMVAYTDGTRLFAHHLPLYHAPHDAQLVYEIDTPHKAQIIERLIASQSQSEPNPVVAVTVLPQVFDLNLLIQGQPLTIPAQWFTGHFERGGTPWLQDSTLTFTNAIHIEKIETSEPRHKAFYPLEFNLVYAAGGTQLVMHRIKHRPSFDAVVSVSDCAKPASREVISERGTMTVSEILSAFTDCSELSLLYYETADFAH